jgi:hypothetical protein
LVPAEAVSAAELDADAVFDEEADALPAADADADCDCESLGDEPLVPPVGVVSSPDGGSAGVAGFVVVGVASGVVGVVVGGVVVGFVVGLVGGGVVGALVGVLVGVGVGLALWLAGGGRWFRSGPWVGPSTEP